MLGYYYQSLAHPLEQEMERGEIKQERVGVCVVER